MASGVKLDMNWLPLQTRKGCPLGLKNLGNSCYLNSVLQCLTYTPPLANFCLLSHHSSSCTFTNSTNNAICLFCIVEKRISRSLSIDSVSESPARIHSCLALFAKHFRQGWQEDAHEFLRYVIEACNSVCVKLHKVLSASKLRTRQDSQKLLKEEPRTVVKDIFGGVLQSQVKCLSCKAESNKLDEMMDLSLDVFKMSSVKDALCRYFQPEILDGSNKYKCEKCKKLTAARKQMSVSQAPNVLVIQLKRFENFFGGKIDRHISFEEHLELFAHMCHDSQDQRPEYLLYAVIVHAGHSQDSGHYYSYVKDVNGKWFCCNDAHVTTVSAKSVISEKAYILFYIRKTSKPAVKCFGASQNGNTFNNLTEKSRVATVLKEPAVKENGFVQKSTSSSGFTGKDSNVQQVRFNLVKPGVNGHARKPFGNDIGRAGNQSKDLGQPKRQLGVTSVVSNGNTEDSEDGKIDATESHERGLESQRHGASSNGNQHQSSPANGSSHNLAAVSSMQDQCLELKENGCFSAVPPLRQEGQSEVVSNGGHSRGCSTEEIPNSFIIGLKPQHMLVQESVAACLPNDGCKAADKLGTRLSNGGGKAELPGSAYANQDKHSQDLGAEAVTNHEAQSEIRLSEVLNPQELKLRLASESREWLLKSGWCDTVRSSFRQLKRERLAEDAEYMDEKRKSLRIEVFGSVHDSLRQKVPKELKEYLVKQLHVHFASQRLQDT